VFKRTFEEHKENRSKETEEVHQEGCDGERTHFFSLFFFFLYLFVVKKDCLLFDLDFDFTIYIFCFFIFGNFVWFWRCLV